MTIKWTTPRAWNRQGNLRSLACHMILMLLACFIVFLFTFVFLSIMNPILPHLPWIDPTKLVHEDPLDTAFMCASLPAGFAFLILIISIWSPVTRVTLSDEGLNLAVGHSGGAKLSEIQMVIFRQRDGQFRTVRFIIDGDTTETLALPADFDEHRLRAFLKKRNIDIEDAVN